MRRHDKKAHMKRVNLLFEQRCNEEKFSWNGKYTNENDDEEDYHYPFNVNTTSDKDENYTDPYELREKENAVTDEGTISLGDDLEVVEEDNETDTTDVENSKWFSDVDGERLLDKTFN